MISGNRPIHRLKSSGLRQIQGRQSSSRAHEKRSGDFPVPRMAGWKTRHHVTEAEARETDKALKDILEKIGV